MKQHNTPDPRYREETVSSTPPSPTTASVYLVPVELIISPNMKEHQFEKHPWGKSCTGMDVSVGIPYLMESSKQASLKEH